MVWGRRPTLTGSVPDNLPVPSRPKQGAVIGGVCAGLGRRAGIDPTIMRIAAVVTVFFGGLGIAGYLAGLLLMPRDGQIQSPVRRFLPFTRSWPTPTLVTVVVLAAVAALYATGFSGIGLGPAGVVFVVWFFGFRRHGRRSSATSRPEPTPFERASDAWRVRLAEQQTPGYATTAAVHRWQQPYTDPAADLAVTDNAAPERHPVRPGNRWRLWWLALTLAGLGSIALVLLRATLGLSLGPVGYLAVALASLGVTLIVAARAGRPPLMMAATVATAVATCWMMLLPYSGSDAIGDVRATYSGAVLPTDTIRRAAGDVRLDLSGLDPQQEQDLTIDVGAGDVSLKLPTDARNEVRYQVGLGDVSIDGSDQKAGYYYQAGTRAAADAPLVRITVRIGAGDLTVTS